MLHKFKLILVRMITVSIVFYVLWLIVKKV